MLKYLQKALGRLGELEYKYFYLFIIGIILFTGIALVGVTKLEYESDFTQFNPEGIPAVDLDNRVNDEFPSFSSFLVIVELDDEFESDIIDIRDPEVIKFLVELQDALSREDKIQEVRSIGRIFENNIPESLEESKAVLNQIPGNEDFFNARYSMTPVLISVDVSQDNEKIKEINNRVIEIVESTSKPGGVRVSVTGEPPLFTKIFDLMLSDGLYTLILATIAILIMLIIIQRSVKDSVIIILPVLFGVIWTAGGMGWFGIKVTIATAALGAMLLGLGAEYSIFLNTRYNEERRSVKGGIVRALSTTGASTVSSGITTMVGFFALTLSVFPILSDLGFTLGMGIGLILTAVMTVGPILIISRDKYFSKEKKTKKKTKKLKKDSKVSVAFEKYGKIVSYRPGLVIIVAILVTGVMFYGSNLIQNESVNFDTILPEDLPELESFNLFNNEFGDTTSIRFFIELDTTYIDSDEPIDIRDPRIIKYSDVLASKAETNIYVEEVRSVSFLEKEINNGIIPGSLQEQKKLLENIDTSNLITEDYRGMIVTIILNDAAFEHREEIVREMQEIIQTTEKPAGIMTYLTGGIVVEEELNKLNGPDSSKTAIVAFSIIIVLLFALSRSIKYTILPLITVVVAIFWILGLVGYFQIGWNEIISSVLSMTIGIGIDFGIQLSNRFRQELETHEKRIAMTRTLKFTLYPMIITVVAALIGFQAMRLGELQLMGNLGRTMGIGMISSMLVAVSLVAALMVVFERGKKKKTRTQKYLKNKNRGLLDGEK